MLSGRYMNESRRVTYKQQLLAEEDKEILSAIRQDQAAAFARYRERVQARKEREKLHPREPEVYHHNICKKS